MANKKYGDHEDPNNEYIKLIPYWTIFKKKYSSSSLNHVFLALMDLAIYSRKNFNKNLLELSGKELLQYFVQVINEKKVSKSTKRSIRYYISGYYKYVEKYKKDIEGERFDNPVPSLETFDFDGPLPELQDLQGELDLLTMKDIKKILHRLYYVKPNWMYVAGSLIIYSGARVSEVASILLENLDVKNRWFLTKVKSSRSSKRMGIYFFPKFFIPDLEHYIKTLELEHPRTRFLFPSSHSWKEDKHVNIRTIEKYFREVGQELELKARTNPHAFRDFINSKREEKGCSTVQRKLLLNQTIRDVNVSHYLKKYKNRIHLRSIYDKYDPFKPNVKPNPKL